MKKLIFLLGTLGILLSKNSNSQEIIPKVSIVPGSGIEYKMPLEEAEKQLHNLAKNSYIEDAWMYHNGKLTDVGVEGTRNTFRMDMERIFSIEYKPEDTIYFFHTHPREGRKIKLSPPSELDYMLDQDVKIGFDLNKCQIIPRAFDGVGKWTYRSNDVLYNDPGFSYDNMDRNFNLYKYLRYAYKSSVNPKRSKKKEIKKFVEDVELLGLDLMYEKMK